MLLWSGRYRFAGEGVNRYGDKLLEKIDRRRLNVEPIVGHIDGAPGRAILLAAAGRRASLLTSGPRGKDIAA